MYARSCVRCGSELVLIAVMLASVMTTSLAAQATAGQHDMAGMVHGDGEIPATREGSGTSWLPDESPMYAVRRQANGWMLMAHGSAFLQYLKDSGDRGNQQTGSI